MKIPKNYRLVPVALSPAIKDAIFECGYFYPETMWQSIIAKIDLVSGHTPVDAGQQAPIQSAELKQFRKCGCSDWYDGIPDQEDGGGPYESRTLYTAPSAQQQASTAQEQAASVPVNSSAAPSVPGHLREFVEAIAYTYDRADGDDESVCLGCSGLIEHDASSKKEHAHHRADCLVLRAQAALAAPAHALTDAFPAVMLTRMGHTEMCEVSLCINKEWIVVLRDNGTNISHIVEPLGIRRALAAHLARKG